MRLLNLAFDVSLAPAQVVNASLAINLVLQVTFEAVMHMNGVL
jgi:hypothetical protein